MSAPYRTDDRRTDGPVAAGAVARRFYEPGMYLTNEVFLYRVVGFSETAGGEVVELEDCYRLDVVRVPVTAVGSRRLRLVTPAPIAREADGSSRTARGLWSRESRR